MTVIFKLNF